MDMSVSFNTLILNGRGCHSSRSWGAVTNLNTHFNSISLNNLRSLVTLPTLTLTDLKLNNTWGIQWECRKWQMTGSRKKWTLRQFVLRPEKKLNNKKNLIWWNVTCSIILSCFDPEIHWTELMKKGSLCLIIQLWCFQTVDEMQSFICWLS